MDTTVLSTFEVPFARHEGSTCVLGAVLYSPIPHMIANTIATTGIRLSLRLSGVGLRLFIVYFLLAGWLVHVSSALPGGSNTALPGLATDSLESLDREFPGIEWAQAFGANDCTEKQRKRMVRAFRDASTMMSFPFRDRTTEKELIDSSAWDRYFGTYESWLRLPHDIGQAEQLKNNLLQASKFPTQGRLGSSSPVWKI
jgi:hypothetical protein